MPCLNSYFISQYEPFVVDLIKDLRHLHIGGDKYIGKGVWEVTEQIWNRLRHLPHTFEDLSTGKPVPKVFKIDENCPKGKYYYQELAAEELRNRTEALLFFDTGTGKTRTSLLALSALNRQMDAIIVVGESNLSIEWLSQVKSHFDSAFSDRFVILNDGSSIKKRVEVVERAQKGTIFIVNIHSIRNKHMVSALNNRNLAVCILDECQCIIGSNAQQTQGIHDLKSDSRWALSATPIKNSPLEWYSLLAWLRVIPFEGAKTRFKEYYAVPTINRYGGWEYTTFRNEEDLEDLKNLVSLRVEKIGLNLPPKNVREVILHQDRSYTDLMADIKKQKKKDWIDYTFSLRGSEITVDSVPGLFYIERIATSTVRSKIDFILSNMDEQIIVVSCLKFPLDLIHSIIPDDSVLYHGDISDKDRQDNLEKFKQGQRKVLLMTRKSGGVGLTLVNCHRMVFLDAPDNMADFNQCADRVHRIGQTRPVDIYLLKVNDSIDTYAWAHLEEKQGWISRYYKVGYEEDI